MNQVEFKLTSKLLTATDAAVRVEEWTDCSPYIELQQEHLQSYCEKFAFS